MTPRLHDDEVDVRDDVVRALVDAHDPAWRGLPLRRVPSTGTDNVVYHLGDDLGVRVPRIHWAVDQVAKEARWLPALAPHVPCRLPEPVAVGRPGHGYPYDWLVFRWLPGSDLGHAVLADDALTHDAPTCAAATSDPWPASRWASVAGRLGDVVRALHAVRLPGAPLAGSRGRPLAPPTTTASAA